MYTAYKNKDVFDYLYVFISFIYIPVMLKYARFCKIRFFVHLWSVRVFINCQFKTRGSEFSRRHAQFLRAEMLEQKKQKYEGVEVRH